ncbi:thioredoxin domain-containing protein [Acaryochloris sp. CCMEE 5410]|uniref:thioredoxin domain-containing protein n=1 Tax=Acaryochloris sp. CCMEE 5410 TaxID=310037 RepID=UPI00030BE0DF|nr:thioredoxin domain-containing protein [Acaryochloris sp. CCMEE 5410]KAI9130882.1 thioredoxin domain-containing protein [Acaryochloris sp. CCMEE 5410]
MPNRLAHSASLYLRKHADNPIDWWPWCEEALERAAQENKPIFLSVGYSSCHWCTVMEGEAFSNSEIAKYMNAQYIPIKVDREERPDIDSIYMQAVQAMTGQGGWPLNMFLSPGDLVPFYGGTYFPEEPKYGRPGFLQVLEAIRSFYDTEKEKLDTQKEKLSGHLQSSTVLNPIGDLQPELLSKGIAKNTTVLINKMPGPSFPMMPYATIALHGSRFSTSEQEQAQQACRQRGLDLALGGIYDHVAGGFHRYTVDPTWTVPHFEKMLYDNGQIVEYLANLWSTGVEEPAFKRAIAVTVAWLQREMTAEAGYFYAAQDADNFVTTADIEPEEGRFYTWTDSELTHLLTPEEYAAMAEIFNLSVQGNFEDGLTVLQRQQPGVISETVEEALQKLFQVRYGDRPESLKTFPPATHNQVAKTHPWPGRIPPVTDTKMIVAWNSLMISGLARAAAVFQQPDYLALATKAASFILDQQWSEGRLHRVNYDGEIAVIAQSEDYALLIKAFLDLHQACQSLAVGQASRWLEAAQTTQAEFDEHLWAVEGGGYFNTGSEISEELLIRERSWLDNATPAANGVAIANLIRLSLFCDRTEYLSQAEQALQTFGQVMDSSTQACPSLFVALDWYFHHTSIRTSVDLASTYLPTAVYSPSSEVPPGALGLVCQGFSCLEPAMTMAGLHQQISDSLTRHQV